MEGWSDCRNAGIVAFDKNTGDVLWQSTKHGFSCSSPVATTIDGKRYAFFFTRRTLCALDPASGKVYFNYAVNSPKKDLVLCANPVIIDDLLFVSAAYELGGHLLRVHGERYRSYANRVGRFVPGIGLIG